MDMKLQDQYALITGSTAGIGFAIANALAAEGVRVCINGRTQLSVSNALERLNSVLPHSQCQGVVADAGTAVGCQTLIDQCSNVDILVNNLGIFEPKPFEDILDAEWQHFFETNVMSGVRLSRAYLPSMMQRNKGRIVFISSEAGICPPAGMVHYGMTKSAQLSIARGLAETCAGTAVTVNSVLPGPTLTEGAKAFFETMGRQRNLSFEQAAESFFKNDSPTSLLKRFITPDEIANMVTYVCSPLSAATNGAALRVDGGVVRSLL